MILLLTGLLQGAGWNPLPEPRMNPSLQHMYSSNNSVLKYSWKFMQIASRNILLVMEATSISGTSQYEAVTLILTSEVLVIVNTDEDIVSNIISLGELKTIHNNADPTLLCLKLCSPVLPVVKVSI